MMGLGVAENHEVDEVDHELAEDDGKLVPRHEGASDVGGATSAIYMGHTAESEAYAYAPMMR